MMRKDSIFDFLDPLNEVVIDFPPDIVLPHSGLFQVDYMINLLQDK